MTLELDPDELNTCVACGLCLPACPTYRVTGEEGLSPRGRIDAMRGVELRDRDIDEAFTHFMTTCVQCRGCEPACPSGVPYGHLIERTRSSLAHRGGTPRVLARALDVLTHHRVILAGSTTLALVQRTGLVPKRLVAGRLPIRRGPSIRPTAAADTNPDAWLFTGCVMDAWFRDVHRATATVLDALQVSYAVPNSGGACCGALHQHAGLEGKARQMAQALMASMPGDSPIIVNSAGCGAHLKEYGHLLGTAAAAEFSDRVFDVSEWIEPRLDTLDLPKTASASAPIVVVQDPCHLRNVQRASGPMLAMVRRVGRVIELDDDGLCCGAGGAFSVAQPELSNAIRERKFASIDRAVEGLGNGAPDGAMLLASANPGCAMHLEAGALERGLRVVHPIELVADAVGAATPAR